MVESAAFPQSLCQARCSRGFTLLEVLVVILVIGILLTFASLSINTGVDRQLETEARRLNALMEMAGQDAVLRGRPLFLQVFRDGYRFVEPGLEINSWVPIEDDQQLRARELPPGMIIDLSLDGVKAVFNEKETPPVIGFFPSGELAPAFDLTLVTEEFGRYVLQGVDDGQVTFTHELQAERR